MCKEHGVAEALCVACRPYLKDAFMNTGDWCVEHDTPESQCSICNPEVLRDQETQAPSAGAEQRWSREPSSSCTTSATIVRIASPEAIRAAGFEYAQVQPAPLSHTIERNAELAYDATHYARLTSRAAGVVAEVSKDLGDRVEKGEVVATVDSPDLGSAKSDLLQALETVKLWEANAVRERALVDKGIGVEREALEAETKAAEARIEANRARQRLRAFGLSKTQIESVETDGDTSSLLHITAPFDGTIVEREVVIGEMVDLGRLVIAIADTRVMWALIDLSETDLVFAHVGLHAEIVLDGLPTKTFTGKLTWISTRLDPKTRTVKARVELANDDGLLRANMFGRARVSAGESASALLVPKEAVQWEGCCNVAFVRADAAGATFRPARLLLAYDAGDRYEVAEGLMPGDTVVTRGSHILKNEILKDAVGAGCCEIDHLKK